MPEISIETDGAHTYMILPGEQEDAFWYRMIEQNQIRGILSLSVRTIDNCRQYCYDVTSLQSVKSCAEDKPLGYLQMRRILECIAETIAGASEYLLSENGYLLTPEHIFLDAMKGVQLGYFETSENTFGAQLQALAEYMLAAVNHQEQQARTFAYSFYDKMMEHASLHNLQEFLKQHEGQEEGVNKHCLFTPWAGDVGKKESEHKKEGKKTEKTWYLAWQQDTRMGVMQFFCGSKSRVLIELSKFPCTIGRDASADYCIQNTGISRSHLRIEKKECKLYITDLHSHNGTWLNGKKLKAGIQTRIKEGDRIMLAGEIYRLQTLQI